MSIDELTPVVSSRADVLTEFDDNGAYAIRLYNLTVGEGSISDLANFPILAAPKGWLIDMSFGRLTEASRRSGTGHPLENIEISQGHFTMDDVAVWHRTFEYTEGYDGPINVRVDRIVSSVDADSMRYLSVRREQAIGSVQENGDILSTDDPDILDLNPTEAALIAKDLDSFLIEFLNSQHNTL